VNGSDPIYVRCHGIFYDRCGVIAGDPSYLKKGGYAIVAVHFIGDATESMVFSLRLSVISEEEYLVAAALEAIRNGE
jgi:hypothetical protein